MGVAAQGFLMNPMSSVIPGWISGYVTLPPRAIKDAEGVGYCSQVATTTHHPPSRTLPPSLPTAATLWSLPLRACPRCSSLPNASRVPSRLPSRCHRTSRSSSSRSRPSATCFLRETSSLWRPGTCTASRTIRRQWTASSSGLSSRYSPGSALLCFAVTPLLCCDPDPALLCRPPLTCHHAALLSRSKLRKNPRTRARRRRRRTEGSREVRRAPPKGCLVELGPGTRSLRARAQAPRARRRRRRCMADNGKWHRRPASAVMEALGGPSYHPVRAG